MLSRGILNRLPILKSSSWREVHHHMERQDLQLYLGIRRSNPNRANRNTHVNERAFRKLRGKKTILMDLPDHEEQKELDSLPPDRLRIELLKKGINPYKDISPRVWQEAQTTTSSFYAVIDPYVTLEEKLPFWTNQPIDNGKAKFKELTQAGLHRWHTYRNGTRRIKNKEGFASFSKKHLDRPQNMFMLKHTRL
ncbi:unnamed protein product, partial [Mesorhabditis belari]|uniref:Uncharacterized protein n=1 Tax=Mesorhabditis belari TaxID=2138241 RepID=A0AAF3FMW4_9BILA